MACAQHKQSTRELSLSAVRTCFGGFIAGRGLMLRERLMLAQPGEWPLAHKHCSGSLAAVPRQDARGPEKMLHLRPLDLTILNNFYKKCVFVRRLPGSLEPTGGASTFASYPKKICGTEGVKLGSSERTSLGLCHGHLQFVQIRFREAVAGGGRKKNQRFVTRWAPLR